MTLKRMMTTVVVATPVGSPPPYARLGQGVMGGTIAAMVEGDAVDAKLLLDELQHVFGTEFDRGELTVENLRPVLWAAHWLKSVRPVAQRASELLTLAADRAFEPGSKAAKDCQAVAQVMGSVAITEPHCLTAIEAARKIRVPGDFYSRGGEITALPAGRASAEDVEPLSSRTFSSEELVQLDSSKEGREGLYRLMLDAGMLSKPELASALVADGITPTALLTTDEHQALAEQIRSTADAVEAVGALGAEAPENGAYSADGAGSTMGADGKPAATVSVIEQRVRERAQRRYQLEVLEAFHAFRQFCGPFAPVIDGKPHAMDALLTDLERQCYEQGKQRAGNNAVEYLASNIAYRLEDLLGGAK